MKYLFKIFREKERSEFEKIYKERLNFVTTALLPFYIKPFNSTIMRPLYFLPTIDIMLKLNEIYTQEKTISNLFNGLPRVAKQNFIFDCLVEELQNTNDLEGVKSSKEEIVRSAKELEKNRKVKNRFGSMINSYNKLGTGELTTLENPKDVRKIYDYLVIDEIPEEDYPDGEIFRKGITYVLKSSGSGKKIHSGVTPEEEIIKLIDEMILFLNKEEEMPALIRIAVAHYFFGYIHPFYDGNGRTSRFISSIYLNRELSHLSAISLSRGCNKYRSKYLEAFDKSNSVPNNGEMNYFIDTFLEIIANSQGDMIEELKVNKELLDKVEQLINIDPYFEDKNNDYRKILFILAQQRFFSVDNEGYTVQDFAKISRKSEQYIRGILTEMNTDGLVKKKGKRPVQYYIDDKYFE